MAHCYKTFFQILMNVLVPRVKMVGLAQIL